MSPVKSKNIWVTELVSCAIQRKGQDPRLGPMHSNGDVAAWEIEEDMKAHTPLPGILRILGRVLNLGIGGV